MLEDFDSCHHLLNGTVRVVAFMRVDLVCVTCIHVVKGRSRGDATSYTRDLNWYGYSG